MRDIWLTGGPILWIILVAGVIGFFAFIERSLHLHRARIPYDDFLAGIFNILKRDNVDEALSICRETPGPVSQLVKTSNFTQRIHSWCSLSYLARYSLTSRHDSKS